MSPITATAFRKDLYKIIQRANEEHTPIAITNSRGKGAVLIGEDDWADIEETLYLSSIPRMSESLLEGKETGVDELLGESDLEW